MDAWGQVEMAAGRKSVGAVNLQDCDLMAERKKTDKTK